MDHGIRREDSGMTGVSEYVGWLDDEWNQVLDQSQPIVRCRDCKHYDIEERCCWFFAYYEEVGENEWERVPFEIEPTGFCVRGERRDA